MESKVLSMKPVSLHEVRETLKARKEIKELTYEQEQTMKYVEKFGKLTEKQTESLLADLAEIEFLKEKEELLFEIANVLPTRVEQVQLMLPKDVTATEDDLKKVVTATEKYADKLE